MKALLLSAAIAVCCSAAHSATIERYDYLVRYEGTSFWDVFAEASDGTYHQLSSVGVNENTYGLPDVLPTVATGSEITFRLRYFIADGWDDINQWPDYHSINNGGYALTCQIGPFDCSNRVSYTAPGFQMGWNDSASMLGNPMIGGTISYSESSPGAIPYSSETAGYSGYYQGRSANFTIIEQIAPVPLPASAALLIAGMGGLAFMRRCQS